MNRRRSFWDKFWKDKDGKQGIIQPANPPLIGWAVITVASKFVPPGNLKTALEFVAFACLVVWASMEAIRGVSYFRQFLGVLVLFFAIYLRLI